jgi:excisionase family DNA binding protein
MTMTDASARSMGVELIEKHELAKLLGVSTRSIDRWISNGEFPKGIKFGSGSKTAVRWPKSAVEAWVAKKFSEANS